LITFLGRVFGIARCPSVCPSVRPSVNNATKGFEKAGIHPFRDDIFTEEDFLGKFLAVILF